MIDFNDVESANLHRPKVTRDQIRCNLIGRLESVLVRMFAAGKRRGSNFLVGDVLGSPGDSLQIVLEGEKAGLWTDRATGDGGDIFDLIAAHHRLDTQADFAQVMVLAGHMVGQPLVQPPERKRAKAPLDELGQATAKWD